MIPQPFMFSLGDSVKDQITGYAGVIMARVQYLTGCNQYHVKPTELRKGEMVAGEYIDENRLVSVGSKGRVVLREPKQVGGGPADLEPERR